MRNQKVTERKCDKMRIIRKAIKTAAHSQQRKPQQRQSAPQRSQVNPAAVKRAQGLAANLETELRSLKTKLESQRVVPAPAPATPIEESAPVVVKNPDRPQSLADVVGQEELKIQLETCIMGAMLRKERTPHILIQGSPGMGKTSIASLIASMIGAEFVSTSGPMLTRPADLVGLVVKMSA